MKNKIYIQRVSTPCGILRLGSIEDRLCLCDWQSGKHSSVIDSRLKRLLDAEYIDGNTSIIVHAIT